MEKEMTLYDLLIIAKKRIWLILSATFICAALALGYCKLIAVPHYSANANVLIASGVLFKYDNDTSSKGYDYISAGELSTTFALMKSFAGILENSEDYYKTSLQSAYSTGLNDEYTPRGLKACTSISYDDESIFITISVTVKDKYDAKVLATVLADTAPSVITEKLGRTSASVLNVSEEAARVRPRTSLAVILAALFGCFAAVMISVLISRFDNRIKNEEDFKEKYDIALIGVVPEFEKSRKKRRLFR